MKNKKLDELNQQSKIRPSLEEQIAFIEELGRRSKDRLERMKEENPDVVE